MRIFELCETLNLCGAVVDVIHIVIAPFAHLSLLWQRDGGLVKEYQ